MNILILARSFAPDSNIASVRVSKFAKYLAKQGHNIVIIRSGLLFGKYSPETLEGLENVRIVSYEGTDSPAERALRGEPLLESKLASEKSSSLPNFVKQFIHIFYDPFKYYLADGYIIKNKILNTYDNSKLPKFDVIISTFSPLGCIQAGNYIRRKEKCKWVIDFRDLMDNSTYYPIIRKINYFVQKSYLKIADACLSPSQGSANKLCNISGGVYKSKVYTLHNGYDNDPADNSNEYERSSDSKLHICYTGSLYGGMRDSSPLFSVISSLGVKEDIILDYAGNHGELFKTQAKKFNLQDIVVDHGYLSRKDVNSLQKKSDIFLVISWNTSYEQGILTGKFYEALQNRKPVIALISGNVPDSELSYLIHKYNIGVCYEEARKEKDIIELTSYLSKQLELLKTTGKISYNPIESVFSEFEYSGITKKLESILLNCINESKR